MARSKILWLTEASVKDQRIRKGDPKFCQPLENSVAREKILCGSGKF
jgi:hypothetical protein